MTVQTIKQTIHQMIDRINDEDLLQAYLKIIESGLIHSDLIIGYTAQGEPLTKEKLITRVKEASARVKSGDYISHEDLEKEAKNW